MSKNAVVIFNGTQQHTFTGNKGCIVSLNPGKNVVSIEKLETLAEGKFKSETFIDKLNDGDIRVLDEGIEVAETKEKIGTVSKNPADDEIVLNVSEMGAREAVAVINAETSVDTVKGYLETEQSGDNRATVVKAAETAIEQLSKDDDTNA